MSGSEPMVEGRKERLPRVYGDTPSFLGCPAVKDPESLKGYDVAVLGLPWEGTITWGSYSGCELAPRTIRHAAARYGGYLPEYDIDLLEHLRIADAGDVAVVSGDAAATMQEIKRRASEIVRSGAIPVSFGGDHSVTPAVVEALGSRARKIGIVHFDSHFDNTATFGKDEFPRCGPLHRIAMLPYVKTDSIVHVGIRGPRNAPEQMRFAREIGATVFTSIDIRTQGFPSIVEQILRRAHDGTDAVYITICSDAIDASSNPGGPPDFDGLWPQELFYALHRLGERGFAGIDFVEVYPLQDPHNRSSHLAAWSIIHALAGLASGRLKKISADGRSQ